MVVNQANLSGISRSFSTIFNQAFDQAPSQWQTVAMQTPSAGRSVDYKWLGNFPNMREWLGERVIKDLSAYHYEIVNKDFEATVEVNRNDIEDDLIGVYTPMIQGLGFSARVHPDQLIFALLKAGFTTPCFDGQNFFDDDHVFGDAEYSNVQAGSGTPWYLLDLSRPIKPLILQRRKNPEFITMDRPGDEEAFMRKKFRYGVDDRKNAGFGLWQLAYASKDTLDATNFAAGLAAMAAFKNEEGVPLGIRPTHIVAPPVLEADARQVVKVSNLTGGATNPWFNAAEMLIVPWLA